MLGQHVYIEPDGDVPVTEDSTGDEVQTQDEVTQEDGE